MSSLLDGWLADWTLFGWRLVNYVEFAGWLTGWLNTNWILFGWRLMDYVEFAGWLTGWLNTFWMKIGELCRVCWITDWLTEHCLDKDWWTMSSLQDGWLNTNWILFGWRLADWTRRLDVEKTGRMQTDGLCRGCWMTWLTGCMNTNWILFGWLTDWTWRGYVENTGWM